MHRYAHLIAVFTSIWMGSHLLPHALVNAEEPPPSGQSESPEEARGKSKPSETQWILQRDSRGPLVAAVQRTLNLFIDEDKLNVDKRLTIDGWYGPSTEQAVKKFQASPGNDGLTASGNVDIETYEALEPLLPSSEFLAWMMKKVRRNRFAEVAEASTVQHVSAVLACVVILIASLIVYYLASKWIVKLTRLLAAASTTTWDDALVKHKFFLRVAQFAPALWIYFSAGIFEEIAFNGADALPYVDVFGYWHAAVARFGLAYMVVAGVLSAEAFIRACESTYTRDDSQGGNSIKGIVQATRMLVYAVGAILLLAALSGRNPMVLVAGLGAFMAVILLVFKDSILGLVASIHIISNNLVKIGDWIEMPKYGADGDVKEINLSTLKVQNFDKTVSTIPTYAILTDSFKNWSDMRRAGGRRIKRAIYVDMNTIKVCTPEMLKRFANVELLRNYIRDKEHELEEYNHTHDVAASPVNSRRLTNIGTLCAYLGAYLQQHPNLRHDMTCLVRHLQPTRVGLPIEIYVFCNDTAWATYESVQADIFDHVLAILPEFELRAFQDLTNVDTLQRLRSDGEPWDPHGFDGASQEAIAYLQQQIAAQNQYLKEHPRAKVDTAVRKVEKVAQELNLVDGLSVCATGRELQLRGGNEHPPEDLQLWSRHRS